MQLLCLFSSLLIGAFALKTQKWTQVKQDRCLFRADSGLCHAKIEMYAFDPFANQCTLFYYGGCGGNPNRFSNVNECRVACKIGSSEEYIDEYGNTNSDEYSNNAEYGEDYYGDYTVNGEPAAAENPAYENEDSNARLGDNNKTDEYDEEVVRYE